MKLTDWTAIFFGTASFLISVITLIRSFRSERKSKALALRQKMTETHNLTIETELAILAYRKQLEELLQLADQDENAAVVVKELESRILSVEYLR